MADIIPQIVLGIGDEGQNVVLVGEEGVEAADLAAVLALGPGLLQPEGAGPLAEAVNHLSHGADFAVIVDPQAFEAEYRAKLAKEDPRQPWAQGVLRLVDYGLPDFSEIKAPSLASGTLVFFAVDSRLGLPYRIALSLGAKAADLSDDAYQPLDLTPIDADAEEAPAAEPDAEMKALQEAMQTIPNAS